jgi:hypothetical protein
LLNSDESGSSAGLSDGVPEGDPSAVLLTFRLGLGVSLLGGEVELLGDLLDLRDAQDPDDAGEDVELGEGVFSGNDVGVLEIVGDLLGQLDGGRDSVDLLVGVDQVTLVADEEGEEGSVGRALERRHGLPVLLAAAHRRRAARAAVAVARA